jgi:hypothetical protein
MYTGRLAKKVARVKMMREIQPTRARMRLRPCKRVSGTPDRSELLVAGRGTNASLSGVLMVVLLKLRIKR